MAVDAALDTLSPGPFAGSKKKKLSELMLMIYPLLSGYAGSSNVTLCLSTIIGYFFAKHLISK